MSAQSSVPSHYHRDDLAASIESALRASGIDVANVTVEDLGPVDEFHTGGRAATVHLLSHLELAGVEKVLDVGCGLGGTARHLVAEHGVDVHGIDLTSVFVETGRTLNGWVAMTDRIELDVADALDMPHGDETFDLAVVLHVGMNIEDKNALFAEIARVLKPGGRLALYDVMRTGDGEPDYPLPWASDAATSFIASPEAYERSMRAAGLSIATTAYRVDFAKAFFAKVLAAARSPDGPPPLGLRLLMGDTIGAKIGHYAAAVERGVLAPVEMIATKARRRNERGSSR